MAHTALLLLSLLALAAAGLVPQRVRDKPEVPQVNVSADGEPDFESLETVDTGDDARMHPSAPFEDPAMAREDSTVDHSAEKTVAYWTNLSKNRLVNLMLRQENKLPAKNVILFMGDGMSIPTLAATRVYIGGEEKQLSFETFPYVGLAKTYCVNSQVADSSCSATAYLCGVKANLATMGVSANVSRRDCEGQNYKGNHAESIVGWAQTGGMSTGVVTNTRVTHASPAGAYAHVAEREWEVDDHVKKSGADPTVCKDIAMQLVTESPGKDIDVVLGGGRTFFLPKAAGTPNKRIDGRNLIEEWQAYKTSQGMQPKYVQNRLELLGLDVTTTDSVLGLFDNSHMKYALENATAQPSLSEMTEAAIKILSKNPNGFFLFVEGGRIDHGHHDTMPHIALDETKHFADAVRKAMDLTLEEDTLIVVTADHSHTMSMGGYPKRGRDIFKAAGKSDVDKLSYTTLSYANGPGYRATLNGTRPVLTDNELMQIKTRFPTTVPLTAETHGGDDVIIYARGPWSHLYSGIHEQTLIPHIMAFALSVGEYDDRKSGSSKSRVSAALLTSTATGLLLLALRP